MRFVIVFVFGLILVPEAIAQRRADCGLPPLAPVPPVGCGRLVPVCICSPGAGCSWQFQCVPR